MLERSSHIGVRSRAAVHTSDSAVITRCHREIENCPDEEKQEMIEIYRDRYGFTEEDADSLVNITFKYREFFVRHMMVEELGLMATEGPSPLRRG